MKNYEAWHGEECIYSGGSESAMIYEVSYYLEFNAVEKECIDYYVSGYIQK